jgi:hypothetical protein
MSVFELLVPNDAKDQIVDLPRDIFIRIVEDRDWCNRIDSWGSTLGTGRWQPRELSGSDNGFSRSSNVSTARSVGHS